MPAPAAHQFAETLGDIEALDPVAEVLGKKIREWVPPGTLKDVMSGRWLGHAVHPLLTDVPIGSWTSATLLDLLGGRDAESAAEKLIAIGLLATGPTVATGYTEWADSELIDPTVRRMGLIHAWVNGTAATLYGASYVARKRGDHGKGKLLGLAGAAALGFGGFLGGHLSYARGVGMDATAYETRPEEWTAVEGAAELGEGEMLRARVGDAEVLVARSGGRLQAIAALCTHRGAPLDQGELSDGCVTCPWHGSIFSLADGSVERGPASAPQPPYSVRERDGRVEVRATG
jgi:nitrite reductase/ring-hydroxylating ferredoxin subunit/uncharacterized membrane protein